MLRVKKPKNEAGKAEIYISGDIIDDDMGGVLESWGDSDTGYEWPKAVKEALDGIDEDDDLTVYINSDGGSIPAGVAIANMIARHKGHTTAIVDGWACSIATQIFFAADTRKMPSNAYLMIHKPAATVSGDANDMRQAINALDTMQEGLETTYRKAAREGTSEEDIHAMVEATTWLTGEKASNLFEIDLLDATQTAACAGTAVNRLSNIPKGIKITENEPRNEKPAPQPESANHPQDTDKQILKAKAALQLAIMEGEIVNEEER